MIANGRDDNTTRKWVFVRARITFCEMRQVLCSRENLWHIGRSVDRTRGVRMRMKGASERGAVAGGGWLGDAGRVGREIERQGEREQGWLYIAARPGHRSSDLGVRIRHCSLAQRCLGTSLPAIPRTRDISGAPCLRVVAAESRAAL